jgi:LPXTG-site transpeptidase (sortase) family protein
MIFFLSLSAADSIGFVPDYIDGTAVEDHVALSNLPELGSETLSGQAGDSLAVRAVEPERIVIAAIDLDLAVQNPDTRDIAVLDELLKDGPARYVDSAKLGERGNMIVFAHSSHLPIVHNQMYKAFNRIPELEAGDTIVLEADGTRYLYSVVSLTMADAADTRIDMSRERGTRLTLVTCDTLTGKSARYVLEAEFVATFAI